ncbi:MAG: nuclear transport factor 2 family protein [Chloroflexota bacterium]|nr:nuclear transport factor 2 family protein [Chloroflexota bacterium]
MASDHRAIFERVADIINRQAWDALGTVFTDDFVEEYPQSGEVIRGLQNAVALRRNYPGGFAEGAVDTSSVRLPASGSQWAVTSMFTVVKLEGSGDTATVIFKARYPDGSTWWLTAVYELRGEKIAHSTMLFAPAFDPPDWREPYREPLGR